MKPIKSIVIDMVEMPSGQWHVDTSFKDMTAPENNFGSGSTFASEREAKLRALNFIKRDLLGQVIKKRKVLIDMDGVIADFGKKRDELATTGDIFKKMPGAYLSLDPIEGALEAVRSIIGMGFDVYIATKPPTGIPFAYADKVQWVLDKLPELSRKIIITHHKGLLGDENDFLIDDRPHKAHCDEFKGTLLVFEEGRKWPEILAILTKESPHV